MSGIEAIIVAMTWGVAAALLFLIWRIWSD